LRGKGITAKQFEKILSAYVAALNAGALTTERQREIAVKCAIISIVFLKIGVEALIDERTGYQDVREEDALQLKLLAYFSEEMREWEKTFPDELWEIFAKLTGWKGPIHQRPRWWGKLVIEIIYDALDKDVANHLKENKPPSLPKQRWHQWLKENYVVKHLLSHIWQIIGIGKTCESINELREKVALHFKTKPVQLRLDLPKRGNGR